MKKQYRVTMQSAAIAKLRTAGTENPGKTAAELVRALEAGIGQFNLESEEEGIELAALAAARAVLIAIAIACFFGVPALISVAMFLETAASL